MVTLASGRLRHRVRIEHYVLDLDSNGDVVQDDATGETAGQWLELATVWAAIEPLSAKEFIAAQAMQSQITARIVIRYRSDLDASMRLVHLVGNTRRAVYNPHGFLADKDSGLEYMTIPASAGLIEDSEPAPTPPTGQTWDSSTPWDGPTYWS